MTVRACVVGSTNVDVVLQVPRLPAPGETLLGSAARRGAGGKGANQATALSRLGATVRLVSAVGDDTDGVWSRTVLLGDGVDVSEVDTVPAPTGLAVVMVDPTGENSIVVAPGANGLVKAPADVDADVLLLSLEIPVSEVTAAAQRAHARRVPVVLNAAPATAVPQELLDLVDVLVVNEGEWDLLGRPHGRRVVVTLGAAGCRVIEHGAAHEVPGIRVKAVDTTGAGDCFAAAIAFGVAQGSALVDAARFATVAAALSVTAHGARGGLPMREQVEARARAGA